jgi:hypothetical protein
LVVLCLVVVACGKSEDRKAPAAGTASVTAPPAKVGLTGTLELSGALTGMVTWKDDLAIDCTWIRDTKSGRLDATLSDGKDMFVAISVITVDPPKLTLTSGKLKSAGMLRTDKGFTLTATDDRHITATIDAAPTGDGGTVQVKGKLEATCTAF